MLVDTHCHLNLAQFDADREAALDRARAAGVGRVVVIGIDRATNREVVELAEGHPDVYAVVGYHPNSADEFDAEALDELCDSLRHPRVVALGEIGLDFYWDKQPRELQAEVFLAQLDLAVDMGQPIVVHIRGRAEPGHDAHQATWDILQPWAVSHPWRGTERPLGVLHCFSGDAALANAALQAGFYLGVDGPLTYKNGKALQALAQTWPLDHVVIETDAPYLPPHPHRGQRNEPAYVRLVAEKLAELHGVSLDDVAQATTAAAARLFRLNLDPTLDREPMAHE